MSHSFRALLSPGPHTTVFNFLKIIFSFFFIFCFFQIVCKSSFYFLNILILNLKPNWNYWCYWPYIFGVHVRFTTIHFKPKFKWLKQRWERYCRFFWKNISICYINAQKSAIENHQLSDRKLHQFNSGYCCESGIHEFTWNCVKYPSN